MKKIIIATLTVTCLLVFYNAHGQAPDTSKKYQFFLQPYLMFTSMSGTSGIGNLPNSSVSIPASEVFSHLQFGAMLYAELHNNKFAFTTDLLYASLSQSIVGKDNILGGTVGIKQFWWELEGLYKVNQWFEAGVGTRLNSIEASINVNTNDPTGVVTRSGEQTNTWLDPLIVTRLKTWAGPKWLLSLRTDIGGFGVGSKFAWQVQPQVAYSASKLFQVGLSYRYISMDYDNGKTGSSRFLYDMNEYGPQIQFGFNF